MRSLHHLSVQALLVFMFVGCGTATTEPSNTDDTSSAEEDTSNAGDTSTTENTCQACLDAGKTWQPEADQCTDNCDLMDISCFSETCPGECAEYCSACFNQSACEAASCTWHQEAESMWCAN